MTIVTVDVRTHRVAIQPLLLIDSDASYGAYEVARFRNTTDWKCNPSPASGTGTRWK